MWQSRVEIEHYSVAYFDCVIVFAALYCSTSVKGGAHVLQSCIKVYIARMSPALNESTAIRSFQRCNAFKIHNGIMFNFYPRLPHMCVVCVFCVCVCVC